MFKKSCRVELHCCISIIGNRKHKSRIKLKFGRKKYTIRLNIKQFLLNASNEQPNYAACRSSKCHSLNLHSHLLVAKNVTPKLP